MGNEDFLNKFSQCFKKCFSKENAYWPEHRGGREGWEEWGRDFWSCFCCLDSSPAHVVGPCLARMLWFLRQRQICSGWENIPSLLTLFLLSWNSDGRNVRSFVIVPWVPETVFIFCFSLFSLCCSYWIISILSLSLLILSSLSSFLLLRPSIILISVIIFFSPKISFWFFYFLFIYETLCFFAETFCLFICSKHVHHWSVKHFHNGCFKNSFPVILTSL